MSEEPAVNKLRVFVEDAAGNRLSEEEQEELMQAIRQQMRQLRWQHWLVRLELAWLYTKLVIKYGMTFVLLPWMQIKARWRLWRLMRERESFTALPLKQQEEKLRSWFPWVRDDARSRILSALNTWR